MGFPPPETPPFGGRTLNALTGKVETPFRGLDAETRFRVEQYIGCTIEQSYAEFTVEMKNAVHRMWAAVSEDGSKSARHRGHARRRQQGTRRVS